MPGRVLIGGTGYSQDLRDVCNDSRFDGTLLSYHHYAFFYGENTYEGWRDHVTTRLGNCASRAVTDVMCENQMGGTYWPAIGGKPGTIGYDWYSMYAKSGSGTDLSLTVRKASGANRLRWAWGDDVDPDAGNGGGATTTDIVSQSSGKCVDVVSASTCRARRRRTACGSSSTHAMAVQTSAGFSDRPPPPRTCQTYGSPG